MRGRIPGRNEEPLEPIIRQYGLDLTGSILEFGPGNGQLEHMVAAARGTYLGLDKDPRARVFTMNYEVNPLRLPGGQFDGVFCRNSIGSHWKSLPVLASEINRRMRDDAWGWIALWTGDSSVLQMNDAIDVFDWHGFDFQADYIRTNQILVTRGLS